MADFDVALAKVLVHEGGYVNNPKDPGGATNKGVTQKVYDSYLEKVGRAKRSVKNITPPEVRAIYKSSYWDLAKCDQLPSGVNYVVFDGAVNSGVSQSIKWLQRAVGVNPDGVIGTMTINAVKSFGNDDALVDRICDRRLAFLKALKTWSTFGKGWAARVSEVRYVGKEMADGNDTADIALTAGDGGAKAFMSDAKTAPSIAVADTATGAGGLSAVIAQTQEQLTPYVNIGFVAKAAAILTIAGLVVMLCGIAYRVWAKARAKKLSDALDVKVA